MPLEVVGDMTPLEAAAGEAEVISFGGSETETSGDTTNSPTVSTTVVKPANSPDTEQTPLEAAADEVAGDEEPEAELLREVQGARSRKRISQLAKQRAEEREKRSAAEAERDAIKAERDRLLTETEASRSMADMVKTRYGKYSDPAKAAAFDMDFMDAFEAEAKKNPALGRIAQQIADAIAKGDKPVVDAKDLKVEAPAAEKPAAPATDARVEKILVREATNAATSLLTELKVEPRFAKLITKDLIATQGYDREPTKAEVVAAAKRFAAENGFDLRELSGQPKATKVTKPVTNGPAGADLPAGSGGARGDEKPRPKDRNEWEAGRQERMRAIFGK